MAYLQKGEYSKIVSLIPDVIKFIEDEKRQKDNFGIDMMNPFSMLASYCGISMGYLGSFDRGEQYLDKAFQISTEMNDMLGVTGAEIGYAVLLNNKGEFERTIRYLKNAIKYSEQMEYLWILGISNVHFGYAYSMLGDLISGKNYVEKGFDIYCKSGVEGHLANIYHLLGLVEFERNEFDKAHKKIVEALKLSRKNGEKAVEGRTYISYGGIFLKREPIQIENAEKYILMGIDIVKELQMKPDVARGHLYLGELYLIAEQEDKAMFNFKMAKDMFADLNMEYWLGRTQNLMKKSK